MIKYLIMDVDGTLTDGKIYIGPEGETMKAFSVKDGYAFNYVLKPNNIRPVIITARTSEIVQKRCDELGVSDVYQGKLNKLEVVHAVAGENNLRECAYFGDDILDLKCMKPIKEAGGIVGCPSDAVSEVKAIADYVCNNRAGEGALREFSEWLVEDSIDDGVLRKRINEAVAYLKAISVDKSDIGKKIDVNDYFYYSIIEYETKNVDLCELESHRLYVDVQVMVKGSELIDIVDISKLQEKDSYEEALDVQHWKAPKHMARVKLQEGDYIILFPENGHRGAVAFDKPEHVVKIVGKVLVKK